MSNLGAAGCRNSDCSFCSFCEKTLTMYIETWEGWIWKCPFCGYYGRIATQEETEHSEKVDS